MKIGVFLDRDGVINHAIRIGNRPYSPRNTSELVIIDGVVEAVKKLKAIGLEVVIVTNQPDVSRSFLTLSTLKQIHQQIKKQTSINHFYICTHVSEIKCSCRKPKPGLLNMAAQDLNINLRKSFLVGDRSKDIEAGQKVGCKCFYIDYNYQELKPKMPYTKVKSLQAAADLICNDVYVK